MSDFDLKRLSRLRGQQPRVAEKCGPFHWDRAVFYENHLQDRSTLSVASEPNARHARPNNGAGHNLSSSLILPPEDEKSRRARAAAARRAQERERRHKALQDEAQSRGSGMSTRTAPARRAKAALQLAAIERQAGEIRSNAELIRQLEAGELEPGPIAERHDRDPQTNAARNAALRERQQTVSERREAERRIGTIRQQDELLRQQRSLIRRLERGGAEFTPPPRAKSAPPKDDEGGRRRSATKAGRAYADAIRQSKGGGALGPKLSLSVESRRRSGLDGRGATSIIERSRAEMEAMLSPALRDGLSPLSSRPEVKPAVQRLAALEARVFAEPENANALNALGSAVAKAQSALASALHHRVSSVSIAQLSGMCRELESVGELFEPEFDAVWGALAKTDDADAYREPLTKLAASASGAPHRQQRYHGLVRNGAGDYRPGREDGADVVQLYSDACYAARGFGEAQTPFPGLTPSRDRASAPPLAPTGAPLVV